VLDARHYLPHRIGRRNAPLHVPDLTKVSGASARRGLNIDMRGEQSTATDERGQSLTMQATSAEPAPESDLPPIRIILVDDHAIVREGVRAILDSHDDLQVVAEFANGVEALSAAAQLSADLALVDLKMPGISAVETIRGLQAQIPGIRILVFTSFGEDALIRATLDAGAIGYLLKDALQSDLVRAIRSVAAGEAFLAPAAQRQLMELLRKPQATKDALTAREAGVLRLLAEGLSNKQIGRRLNLTEGTVKGYVSQILAKLHLEDRTQAALYAVRTGMHEGHGAV
jgi:DNA-binding NarL/FixJ family response regulator